jgi:hypothetical protein
MPARIQRRRTKGWRMPANTVCVTRPGVFGNPWKVEPGLTAEQAVRNYRAWLEGGEYLLDDALQRRRLRLFARLSELIGKNLACYCAPGAPCHADVLLAYVNGPRAAAEAGS